MDRFVTPLSPVWVTGFMDGEGCFFVGFSKKPKLTLGIEVRPSFSVSQGSTSKDVMIRLAQFFKQSETSLRRDRYTLKYETRAADHLRKEICPHFDKYPLESQKQGDFLKFKQVLLMMLSSQHL